MAAKDPNKGRIRIRLGNLRFDGEGTEDWLSAEASLFLRVATDMSVTATASAQASERDDPPSGTAPNQSLAAFLRATGGEKKQVQRFLATAGWLSRRGQEPLTSGLVSKTLREYHQKRLGNPSDCLSQNLSNGYCEKTHDGFRLTSEGWQALRLDK